MASQEQILKQVVSALSQGSRPEDIVKAFVEQGVPQEQATQLVQAGVQHAQKSQMPKYQEAGSVKPYDIYMKMKSGQRLSREEKQIFKESWDKFAEGLPGREQSEQLDMVDFNTMDPFKSKKGVTKRDVRRLRVPTESADGKLQERAVPDYSPDYTGVMDKMLNLPTSQDDPYDKYSIMDQDYRTFGEAMGQKPMEKAPSKEAVAMKPEPSILERMGLNEEAIEQIVTQTNQKKDTPITEESSPLYNMDRYKSDLPLYAAGMLPNKGIWGLMKGLAGVGLIGRGLGLGSQNNFSDVLRIIQKGPEKNGIEIMEDIPKKFIGGLIASMAPAASTALSNVAPAVTGAVEGASVAGNAAVDAAATTGLDTAATANTVTPDFTGTPGFENAFSPGPGTDIQTDAAGSQTPTAPTSPAGFDFQAQVKADAAGPVAEQKQVDPAADQSNTTDPVAGKDIVQDYAASSEDMAKASEDIHSQRMSDWSPIEMTDLGGPEAPLGPSDNSTQGISLDRPEGSISIGDEVGTKDIGPTVDDPYSALDGDKRSFMDRMNDLKDKAEEMGIKPGGAGGGGGAQATTGLTYLEQLVKYYRDKKNKKDESGTGNTMQKFMGYASKNPFGTNVTKNPSVAANRDLIKSASSIIGEGKKGGEMFKMQPGGEAGHAAANSIMEEAIAAKLREEEQQWFDNRNLDHNLQPLPNAKKPYDISPDSTKIMYNGQTMPYSEELVKEIEWFNNRKSDHEGNPIPMKFYNEGDSYEEGDEVLVDEETMKKIIQMGGEVEILEDYSKDNEKY